MKKSITILYGVNDLIRFLKDNPYNQRQIDQLLSFFPCFNPTYNGFIYSQEMFNCKWGERLHTVILMANNQILGYGQLLLHNYPYAEIFNVIVPPVYRGSGYGNLIINELEKIATNKGRHILFLWSSKNTLSFYAKHQYYDLDVYNSIDQTFKLGKYLRIPNFLKCLNA